MFLVCSTFLGIEHCFYSTDKHSISLKPDYHFISIVFVIFCFFQQDSCVPRQAMLKSMSAHVGHVGLSQAEV